MSCRQTILQTSGIQERNDPHPIHDSEQLSLSNMSLSYHSIMVPSPVTEETIYPFVAENRCFSTVSKSIAAIIPISRFCHQIHKYTFQKNVTVEVKN